MIMSPTSEWSDPIPLDGPTILRVNTGRVLVAWNYAPQNDADGIEVAAGDQLTFGAVSEQSIRVRAAAARPCRVFIGPWWSA